MSLKDSVEKLGEDMRPEGCDAEHPSVYMMRDGTLQCRCLVCSRCGRHTGNNTQGHYWAICSKTRKREGFHMCCPDLPCEYPDE